MQLHRGGDRHGRDHPRAVQRLMSLKETVLHHLDEVRRIIADAKLAASSIASAGSASLTAGDVLHTARYYDGHQASCPSPCEGHVLGTPVVFGYERLHGAVEELALLASRGERLRENLENLANGYVPITRELIEQLLEL